MGFLVGVANAFTVTLQNATLRRLSGVGTYVVNFFRFAGATVVAALLVTLLASWDLPPRPFWLILGITVPLELAIGFCYVRAFQRSPQSLVGPLFSLSAIFLIPIAYFLLGERPSPLGFIGIASALTGALALGWDVSDPGVRQSLRRIFDEAGSYYMLGAAIAAGAAVAFAKSAYVYAPPLVYTFWVSLMLALFHAPALFLMPLIGLRGRWRDITLAAGFFGVGQALHFIGIGLLLAAYYISVKRLSVVFDVFTGKLLGREDHFRERFVGAALMVAGVVLIAFG